MPSQTKDLQEENELLPASSHHDFHWDFWPGWALLLLGFKDGIFVIPDLTDGGKKKAKHHWHFHCPVNLKPLYLNIPLLIRLHSIFAWEEPKKFCQSLGMKNSQDYIPILETQ